MKGSSGQEGVAYETTAKMAAERSLGKLRWAGL